MKIQITGQHIDLGSSLRTYIESAVDGIVSKYFDDAVSADIRIHKQGEKVATEIAVHPTSGVIVRSHESAADAYASFDAASNKISAQLARYKNKMKEHKTTTMQMVDMYVIEDDKAQEIADAPIIIAEMQKQLPECTVSGAVMMMDLAGLPALLFKNTAHGGFNMVYRREDGNVGWVDPKNK